MKNMKKFRRKIGYITINVIIEYKLYIKKSKIFNSLFRTYSYCEIIPYSNNEYFYYIYDAENPDINIKENQYFSKCNIYDDKWIFVLIKDLEDFYSQILTTTIIHGSCVRINGKSVLLVGKRWSGKTTLTHFFLTGNECEYLGDDAIYIFDNYYIGFGMPLPMRTIDNKLMNSKYIISKTIDSEQIVRTLFSPPHVISCLEHIDIIVIPQYNYNCNSEEYIEKLTQYDSFNEIIKNISSHKNMVQLFNDVKKLAINAETFKINYRSSESAYQLLFCQGEC